MSLSRIATGAVSAWEKPVVPLRFFFQALHVATCCRLWAFSLFTRCVWSLALFPQSLFVVFHPLCVSSHCSCLRALPSSTGCVWMGRCCLESVCLLSRARHWRRNLAGTTHVVRPCFQKLLVDVCTLSLVSCFVTPLCRRCTLADQANLLAAVSRRQRLLTPAAVAAFADQAPRGQQVTLDQFRLLLIDRSAELVESFLPSRGRIWRRLASTSRQLALLTHLKTHR